MTAGRLWWPGLRTRARAALRGSEVKPGGIERYVRQMREVPLPIVAQTPRETVAIVVPCYLHAAYVATMFESLIRQTRPPEEVVFVVDGSPDETTPVLSRLLQGAPEPLRARSTVIKNERNIGQAASLNRAIGSVTADLVMILNDDDYLMHDAVETALRLLAAHPDLALLGAHSIHFRADAELAAAPKTIATYSGGQPPSITTRRPEDVLRYRRYNDLNMTHTGSCFLRSVWATVSGYEPDIRKRLVPFSDRDFQLRVNALFPVGVSYEIPFSFWRADSSVDHGVNS